MLGGVGRAGEIPALTRLAALVAEIQPCARTPFLFFLGLYRLPKDHDGILSRDPVVPFVLPLLSGLSY